MEVGFDIPVLAWPGVPAGARVFGMSPGAGSTSFALRLVSPEAGRVCGGWRRERERERKALRT